jgi:hypothetical protein
MPRPFVVFDPWVVFDPLEQQHEPGQRLARGIFDRAR